MEECTNNVRNVLEYLEIGRVTNMFKPDMEYRNSLLAGDRSAMQFDDRLRVDQVTDTVWNTYRPSELGFGKTKETTGTAVYFFKKYQKSKFKKYQEGKFECSKCLYHRCEHIKAVEDFLEKEKVERTIEW